MKKNSYAKLNIALNVTNRHKPKDFHDLDMLNVIIDLKDQIDIKFIKNDKNEIIIKCNNNLVPTDEKNLVYKVIEKFKKNFNLSFSCIVNITKNIPLQAGLAGGSSNAAATLKILNEHFKTSMSVLQLCRFLESLTADGPYMVVGKPCRVRGKGEKISVLTSKFKGKVLLVKPFLGCDTKSVYEGLDYVNLSHPNMNKVEEAIVKNDYELLAKHVDNSLLSSACKINNDIKDIILKMKECGFEIVSMTGSGSACFAMSKSSIPYKKAKKMIAPGDYEICKVYKIITK